MLPVSFIKTLSSSLNRLVYPDIDLGDISLFDVRNVLFERPHDAPPIADQVAANSEIVAAIPSPSLFLILDQTFICPLKFLARYSAFYTTSAYNHPQKDSSGSCRGTPKRTLFSTHCLLIDHQILFKASAVLWSDNEI
jgi:hypothetical protein